MKHSILVAIFLTLLFADAAAQATGDSVAARTPAATSMRSDGASAEKLNLSPFFGIGAQLGFATGTGISLRYTDPRRMAGEVNFWYITLSKKDSKAFYCVGAEFQYQLDNSLDSRLYAVGGIGFYSNSEGSIDNTLSAPARIGAGIGYESFISRSAAFNAEVLLTYFTDNTVLPTPQVGFVYYFR